MSCKIYMDHAATTEMLPQVRKAMEPYLMEEYGNASTSYEMGRRTREALEGARDADSCKAGGDFFYIRGERIG